MNSTKHDARHLLSQHPRSHLPLAVRWLLLSTSTLLATVVACGAAPPPPVKLTTEQARATEPSALCARYTSLAKLDLGGDDPNLVERRCLERAVTLREQQPDGYACVVECTFVAKTRSEAKLCRRRCKMLASLP
jgi:hypothetical protein